jgi:ankyrin repeat protein
LNIAAHFENNTVVDALLSARANAHLTKYPAPTLLTNAVTGGFISIATRLLDYRASIQQKSEEAYSTALHLACESTRRENKAMVSLLIEHRASTKEKGADKMTPFHYACRSGNADIVSILLSGTKKKEQKSLANQPARAVTSADLKLHFYNKEDPLLSLACLTESINTIEILLRYGADPLAKDNIG